VVEQDPCAGKEKGGKREGKFWQKVIRLLKNEAGRQKETKEYNWGRIMVE